MPGSATARYYTNHEWQTYESNAARRSAARSAARVAAHNAAVAPPRTRSQAGSGGRSRAAHGSPAISVPAAQSAPAPQQRPALRVVRSSRKKRSLLVSIFAYLLAVVICCGAVPVLVNMAAFHYKAESAQFEKQTVALRGERAELEAQAAMLCATSRLQSTAENLGLEHVSGVAYIEVPGVTCPPDPTTPANGVATSGAGDTVGSLAELKP